MDFLRFMTSGIYLIKNKINGHLYVGKSVYIERRFSQHIWKSKDINSREYNYPIHRAIRKYGESNFSLEVLEKIEPYNEKIANKQERYWIQKFNTFLSNEHYNASSGGEIVCDRQITQKDREKFSKAQKRQYRTEKGKQRAKKHSEDMKGAKNPQYGKHSNGKKVLCVETEKIYPSARAAGKAINRSHTSIISACSGKQKTAGGFRWKYI